MKFLIVLLALVALSCADHHEYKVKTHDDLIKYRDECVSILHISGDLLDKYKKWDYPDDEKTHCYMKCIFEKFGFFDEHYGFDVNMIHKQLVGEGVVVDHTDAVHKKIEHCADKNTEGSDTCTWAYRGGLCFIKENLQLVKNSVQSY